MMGNARIDSCINSKTRTGRRVPCEAPAAYYININNTVQIRYIQKKYQLTVLLSKKCLELRNYAILITSNQTVEDWVLIIGNLSILSD